MARVLLGVTGSVAAVKAPNLYAALHRAGHQVKVLPTRPALSFFDPAALTPALPAPLNDPLAVRGQGTVYFDQDEWPHAHLFRVGDPVLHIELRRWADVLLFAPLDANTLAKLALGLCDNLLTCVYRAWDLSRPVVLAPAMNTLMWEHPVTARHLRQLMEDHKGRPSTRLVSSSNITEAINVRCEHLRIVDPQEKRLACGDEGIGAMADIQRIVLAVNAMAREAIPDPEP